MGSTSTDFGTISPTSKGAWISFSIVPVRDALGSKTVRGTEPELVRAFHEMPLVV